MVLLSSLPPGSKVPCSLCPSLFLPDNNESVVDSVFLLSLTSVPSSAPVATALIQAQITICLDCSSNLCLTRISLGSQVNLLEVQLSPHPDPAHSLPAALLLPAESSAHPLTAWPLQRSFSLFLSRFLSSHLCVHWLTGYLLNHHVRLWGYQSKRQHFWSQGAPKSSPSPLKTFNFPVPTT